MMKKYRCQMVILILVLLSSAVGQGSYAANADLTELLRVKKATEQGDAVVQNKLGDMYYTGQSVDQDYREAVRWCLKAAAWGHPFAQYSLGFMYYYGKGVDKDYGEAAKWYRKAAKLGFADVQYNLGLMCYKGEGVDQDYRDAAK